MKFKETIRTNEQVTEREFDGTLDEIMELFDYLCDLNEGTEDYSAIRFDWE